MPGTQIHGKRRGPRYHLGGVVELTDLDSGRMKVALVRAVSLYGCFVKTEMPVKQAAKNSCSQDCKIKSRRGLGIGINGRSTQTIRNILRPALWSWRQPRNYRLFPSP